jgi:hypothetical protein
MRNFWYAHPTPIPWRTQQYFPPAIKGFEGDSGTIPTLSNLKETLREAAHNPCPEELTFLREAT